MNNKVIKRVIAIVISLFVAIGGTCGHAFTRDGHDEYVESMLFGAFGKSLLSPEGELRLKAIEDALFLAVDQFNGTGSQSLKSLVDRGVRGIPSDIGDIDFTSNSYHRYYTHRGWNNNEFKLWPKRKTILVNTVEHELFEKTTIISSIAPGLSSTLFGVTGEKKQIEAFCILLYYSHILQDHIAAEGISGLNVMAPLVAPNDPRNPGVIPEIIDSIGALITSQNNTDTYATLIAELNLLKTKSEELMRTVGGINTDDKFDKYHGCAVKTHEVLQAYLPTLLKDEAFFKAFFI